MISAEYWTLDELEGLVYRHKERYTLALILIEI